MKRVSLVFASACLFVVGLASSASADTFSWTNSTWDHSSFGGPSSSTGWTNGVLGGTTTEGGVSLTVDVESFGSRLPHEDLPIGGPKGTELAAEEHTVLNRRVMELGASNDPISNLSDDPTNFTRLDFDFSEAVNVDPVVIGDVDMSKNGLWQDFVSVKAFHGISEITVSYTLAGVNQEMATIGSLDGVRGINKVDSTPYLTSLASNVIVTFGGPITRFELSYLQGSPGLDNSHGVWVDDIKATAIPEPATLAMSGLGIGVLGLALRRRLRRA